MFLKTILHCTVILSLAITKAECQVGYNLQFTSNTEEFEDVPIYFDKPPPTWLHGTLMRNGVGRFEVGKRKFTHAFDAYAKLSSWRFAQNGSAYFSSKFIESDFYKDSIARNDVAPYMLFDSVVPAFNDFEKIGALLHGVDNMNVNVYRFAEEDSGVNRYIALSDYWKLYEFEPRSLNTTTPIFPELPKNVKSKAASFLSFMSSAHPLPEYGSPYHITFLCSISMVPWVKSKFTLVRIISAEKRKEIAEWRVEKVPYMHSFSLTKNYAILFASPLYMKCSLKMVLNAGPLGCMDWFPNDPTKVYVIELKTGKILTLETDNVFTVHHVNAFEISKSKIVVDISAYSSPASIQNLKVSIVKDPKKRNDFNPHARLQRYTIDLVSESITMIPIEKSKEVPIAAQLDMPTINEHYRSRNYCYVYGIVRKSDNVEPCSTALVKKDLCNKTGDKMWQIENHYPVEGWFVPTPGGVHEDDGYIVLPVLDGIKKKSYLSIIDARTMKSTSTAYLPTAVPSTFHGRFFDDLF